MRYQFHLAFVALLLACSIPASAQIVNGSFEDDNGFTMDGWTDAFGTPPASLNVSPISEAAPGFGTWSVAPHASQSYGYSIVQHSGLLQSGDIYTLSFWAKCPYQYSQCACLYINGSNNAAVCTNEPVWTEVIFTDTINATGILRIQFKTRSKGLTGNQNPTPAYIDGVSMQVIGHVDVQENQFADAFHFDSESRVLTFKAKRNLNGLSVHDISGRVVQRFGPLPAGQESIHALDMLTPGPYIAIAEGLDSYQALKLVVH